MNTASLPRYLHNPYIQAGAGIYRRVKDQLLAGRMLTLVLEPDLGTAIAIAVMVGDDVRRGGLAGKQPATAAAALGTLFRSPLFLDPPAGSTCCTTIRLPGNTMALCR